MTKRERQSRIKHEITANTSDEYEVNVNWQTFFNKNLTFPFWVYLKVTFRCGNSGTTRIEVAKIISRTGEEIEFGGFIYNSDVLFKFKITEINTIIDKVENLDILNDWFFWKELTLLKKYKR
jgi:hypothetical protein